MARTISARWQSIALVAFLSALVVGLLVSLNQLPKTAAWQSLPAVDKSPRTEVFAQLPIPHQSEKEAVPPAPIQYTGSDIVIVIGSDGHHDLQRHSDQIRGNREDYAARYGTINQPPNLSILTMYLGYDVFWADLNAYEIPPGVSGVWKKVAVLHDAFAKFPQAQWLWWLDFDAVIMTPSIELGPHILNPSSLSSKMRKNQTFELRHLGDRGGPVGEMDIGDPDPNEINLILSTDLNGVNAGSFFLRAGHWTDVFLDMWVEPMFMDREWIGYEQDALVHLLAHHKYVRDHVALVSQRNFNSYAMDAEDDLWREGELVVHFAGCG